MVSTARAGKLALVMKCKEAGTPIICSMGAGNKMDPTRFEVTDIYKKMCIRDRARCPIR